MLLPFGGKLRAGGQVLLLSLTAISSGVVLFPLRPSPSPSPAFELPNPMAREAPKAQNDALTITGLMGATRP